MEKRCSIIEIPFYMCLLENVKNVVLALTDCKNVNPSYVYHLSKFSLKNLFLREFAKMVNV